MTRETIAKQPALFIPHGAGPCFFMDWNPPGIWDGMEDFLRGVGATLPQAPRAIVVVSAHWQSDDFRISAGEQPGLIYDYYGFPAHTYRLPYPAPGEPALAGRLAELLSQAGLSSQLDSERGFDHGMFIPLKLMFPQAGIPVVQLSLRADLDPAAHIAAGAALAPLREDNVLILGSGMSFHNMRAYGNPRYTRASNDFDAWLSKVIEDSPERRDVALANWAQAPAARDCHPPGEEEHLLPLMVVAGAAGSDTGRRVYSEKILETRLSAYRLGC